MAEGVVDRGRDRSLVTGDTCPAADAPDLILERTARAAVVPGAAARRPAHDREAVCPSAAITRPMARGETLVRAVGEGAKGLSHGGDRPPGWSWRRAGAVKPFATLPP